MALESLYLPSELFRGISVPASGLTLDQLTGPLVPGSRVEQPDGTLTVADGNPYGVYMSTNRNMVQAAYADPRYHKVMPGFEGVMYGYQRSMITEPNIGLLFRIDPTGLDIKQPKITNYLMAVANNGFEGREWITDFVPKRHVTPETVKFDHDQFHRSRIIKVDQEQLEVLLQDIRDETQARNEKMRKLGEELLGMTPKERLSSRKVDKVIESIKGKE